MSSLLLMPDPPARDWQRAAALAAFTRELGELVEKEIDSYFSVPIASEISWESFSAADKERYAELATPLFLLVESYLRGSR